MASTGPSQVNQMLNLLFLALHFCHKVEKTPGIQSSEISLFTPYIYLSVIAFGFILTIRYCNFSGISERTSVRMLKIVDLPVAVRPSNMKP